MCHRVLAAALANVGRNIEARKVVHDLIKINPGLTLARYSRDTRFECPADRITLFDGLKRAGLPWSDAAESRAPGTEGQRYRPCR